MRVTYLTQKEDYEFKLKNLNEKLLEGSHSLEEMKYDNFKKIVCIHSFNIYIFVILFLYFLFLNNHIFQ